MPKAGRSVAGRHPARDIEQAQQLFGHQPRPTAEVERLLAACQAAGSTDARDGRPSFHLVSSWTVDDDPTL